MGMEEKGIRGKGWRRKSEEIMGRERKEMKEKSIQLGRERKGDKLMGKEKKGRIGM